MPNGGLVGRDAEIERLTRLVDGTPTRGSSVVIRAEPGLGKSALLDVAEGLAGARGWTVLRGSGVVSESHLPLAALQEVVRPVMTLVDELRAPQRDTIHRAFGLLPGPPP